MNKRSFSGFLKDVREESRAFMWRDALIRMAADLLFVNASMVLAFVLWYGFYAVFRKVADLRVLAQEFKNFISAYWLFWSFLALLVFHFHGFYTRTRGYARRYKSLVVLRAVTIFILLFVFADYFLFRGSLVPRGVALLGWVLIFASVGGARFAKRRFLMHYTVEPKQGIKKVERVLVVGGAGYLGSTLVRQLLAHGYKTRVLDSFMFGSASLAAVRGNPNCEILKGDVRDIESVVQSMKNCDAVIDLAAIVGDPACQENKPLATEVNRAATRMLVDVARGHGITRFLFASTCSVYGASSLLADEQTQPAPISVYAQTKIDSERLLLEAESPNFCPTVLRLATLFGLSPRPRFDLVVNLLTARAIRLGKITIFNGEQWRPFMHVHDAARAFITALEGAPNIVAGEIFNAGSHRLNFRLSELAEKITQNIPTVDVERIDNDDKRDYKVSFDKIHSFLRFECERSLEDGIREIAEMLRTEEIGDFTSEMFNNHEMIKSCAETPLVGQSSIRLLEMLARPE